MEKTYTCPICNMQFKSYSGFYKHKKIKHSDNKSQTDKQHLCKYCNNPYKTRQTKWSHEQKCKNIYKTPIDEKLKQLTDEIALLKARSPSVVNNTTNNTTNTNNIQYVIKAPGTESIGHLSFEKQREIMKKGLNSLTYLIELTNFNKELPENHSYCITSLTGQHASVIDDKTNKIIKADKIDLFDKILISTLKNLETICSNKKFNIEEKKEYTEKLNSLKKILFQNRKGMKRYYREINLISYNNREVILETWASLKSLDKIIESESNNNKLIGFDDLIDSNNSSDLESEAGESTDFSSDEETDSDTNSNYGKLKSHKCAQPVKKIDENKDEEFDIEHVEITIKNTKYIVEGANVYSIVNNKKGDLYGIYFNGKVKKIQSQNKDIDV